MMKKGFVHPLFLASMLAVGFLAVWGVIAFWAVEVGTYVAVGLGPQAALVIPLKASLVFLADGTPVVGYQQPGHRRQHRDLQGNPIEEPDAEHPFLRLAELPAKRTAEDGTDWEQRIRDFADNRVPAGHWYFIADGRRDGSGYFAGYDSENHSCLGYLGMAGLRDQPPPVAERIPFAGAVSRSNGRILCTQAGIPRHPQQSTPGRAPQGSASSWDVYVHGRDGKLYHADLQKRTIRIAFNRYPILSAALTAGRPDAIHGAPYRPAVRTADAVFVLDERGEARKRYPIPESLRGQEINFAETSTGEAVMYANSPQDILATEVEYRICRVDASGGCWQATTVLPFIGWENFLPLASGLVMPSPLALAGTVASVRPSMLQESGVEITYPAVIGRALREFWSGLALAQLLALGLAVLCYRRQQRYGASRTERIVWPLFVLLLGLPGWIGYRFGRSWPVLETCPDCGVSVPRDRESCIRCTNDFSRPALRGTEVFA